MDGDLLGDFLPFFSESCSVELVLAFREEERMWERSGRGGGGKNSSLKTPFPSLVCTVEGGARVARNFSSLLVIPSGVAGGLFME